MAKQRIYAATRTKSELIVQVLSPVGVKRLDPRYDLMNHSPTGFECGYGGSGPAQLALAIVADHLGAEPGPVPLGEEDTARARTVRRYQTFKWHVIANLPRDENWELSSEDVESALAAYEEEPA